jgi:glycerophosphoryl diester phosphodiesterase
MGDDQVLGPDAPSPRPLPMLLAHRGDHRHYPENTLAAFRAALAVPGCDGLEFDVRVSRDGVPIVLHDATLARVQGRPERAAELTAAELGVLEVPTLAAVLATVPPLAFLDVELKEGLGEVFVDVLRSARGSDLANAAVSSFEATALAHVRELAPTWRCWLNANDLSAETLGLARDLGCAGVAALWTGVDGGGMERARKAGLEVVAWTVRDRATLALLTGLGVLGVCVEGAALEG